VTKPEQSPLVLLLADALFGEVAVLRESGEQPANSDELRFLVHALANIDSSPAQLSQDLWVLFELKGKTDGYFVEFGAGDGQRLSNTWLLETKYGWTGVLAEPNPVFHPKLFKNRTCHISTRCIVGDGASEVSFNQTEEPLLSTLDRFSMSDMHLTRRLSGSRITVPAQSLGDLLKEAQAPRRIDYLSLDTEGSEFEILQAFDFSSHDICLITVEHNFTQQRAAIRTLLEANGFKLRFPGLTRFDDWYINVHLIDSTPS